MSAKRKDYIVDDWYELERLPYAESARFMFVTHSVTYLRLLLQHSVALMQRYAPLCVLVLPLLCCRACKAAALCQPPPKFAEAQRLHRMHAAEYGALGNWFQQKRLFSCAATAFRQGILLEPGSGPLHYSLGISLYADGQAEAGAAALNRALALDPKLDQAHLALGVIDHEKGRRSEALAHWQKALLLDPNLVTAIDWIAKARIEAGQYEAAADMLRAAPDNEDLIVDLMVADSKAGLFDEAIKRGQQAVAAHPDWLSVDTALATVLVQRNRYEEAATVLEKAKTVHSGDLSLDLLYLRVLILKGDAATAEPLGEALLKQHPNDFDLLYLNGLLERQQSKFEAALGHLEAAAVINPKHYDVRYNLGFALLKLHRAEEARDQFTKAIALDPSVPEAHFQMAAALRTLNQAEAAHAELVLYQEQMAIRAKHDRDIALSADAAQKLDSGATAAAISQYREVTVDTPEDAQAFYSLAMALDRAGDRRGERIALEEALKLRTSFAAAMNQLGYVASHEGNGTTAEAWFRKAIASAPQFAEAESNLGTLLAGEGRETEAEQHFRSALAANPRYTDAWINLAATLASTSRFTEARGAAENALQIDPGNADAALLLRSLPTEGTAKR